MLRSFPIRVALISVKEAVVVLLARMFIFFAFHVCMAFKFSFSLCFMLVRRVLRASNPPCLVSKVPCVNLAISWQYPTCVRSWVASWRVSTSLRIVFMPKIWSSDSALGLIELP